MKGLPAAICAVLIAAPALADNRPRRMFERRGVSIGLRLPDGLRRDAAPPEGDAVFSRVWQCPATEYALGMVKREHGNDREACASAGVSGWTLPADSDSALEYLIAEIDANVVNPCLLVQIRVNEVFSELDEKVALNLIREGEPE